MQPLTFNTPRGNVIVREGIISDAEQYRQLRLDALQDSPTSFTADYSVNSERPMSFWEDRLMPNENGSIYFAEHANVLIGMMAIQRGESSKTKHSANILSVFVRPEWRGLHLVEALIEACIEWAKSKDVNILKLGVNAANTSAVRAYQRCGFTIYGTEPREMYYNGQYYDGHFMSRDLT